jgi:hypothetical protein
MYHYQGKLGQWKPENMTAAVKEVKENKMPLATIEINHRQRKQQATRKRCYTECSYRRSVGPSTSSGFQRVWIDCNRCQRIGLSLCGKERAKP